MTDHLFLTTHKIPDPILLRNEKETLAAVASDLRTGAIPPESFNMDVACSVRFECRDRTFILDDAGGEECGTLACIGGHAWLYENPHDFAGARAFVESHRIFGQPLHNLFFWDLPDGAHMSDALDINDPLDAAIAINNHLAGKEYPWLKD